MSSPHLPNHIKAHVRNKMRRAFDERGPLKALSSLQKLVSFPEERHPEAASSLREGLEETFSITLLGIPHFPGPCSRPTRLSP